MIKVTAYLIKNNYTKLEWEQSINPGMVGPMLPKGMIEQYMGAYGFSFEETLSYVLADILYEDIDVPFLEDPDAQAKIRELLRRIGGRIEWGVDKDKLISGMALDPDHAQQVQASWSDARAEILAAETPEPPEQTLQDRAAVYVEGHERRQEEILADGMMGAYKPQPSIFNTNLLPPESLN